MFEHIIGISVVAQELSKLSSKVHQTLANLQVVIVVLVRAFGVSRHIQLFA